MPVSVKICGLTQPDDARFAVEHGADYVGVIFASGPRLVTEEQARLVVRAASGVPVLGVFGGQSVDEILALRDRIGLRGAQLHGGGIDAAGVRRLQEAGLIVWRVARIASPADVEALATIGEADAVLVEPYVPHALGGSGHTLAAELAVAARRALAGRTMVLAGGLTAATVAERIALVQPDVVDVSSGVEKRPGIKDLTLIADFLEAARGRHARA